jgi:hypothetical protein
MKHAPPVDRSAQGWSRRAFLRGAAGAAVGLPLMASLGFGGRARADGGAFPKRLVILFSPNGTVPDTWRPAGGAFDFQLSPVLAPLGPHREDLLILDGLNMISARHGLGDGHQTGMGHMLTGRELLEGDMFEGGGGSGRVGWGGGISIDQEVAGRIGVDTKLKSLELGVQVHGATVWSRMSYLGANQPIPPQNDPREVYGRLFGDLDVNPAELIKQQKRRKSVLDLVLSEYNALTPRLDAFDRQKLEAHATAIREVESRLQLTVAGVSETCVKPAEPGFPDHMDPANYEAVGRLQMDLLVSALACDITRVATVQFSHSVSQHVFSNLGIYQAHHDLSHEGDSNLDAQDKLMRINRWYCEQMRYLIEKMKAVPEGASTLFDNSVIVWVNELGKGNSHTRDNVPYVLAGSAGGYFQTGRYLRYPGTSHTDLLLTLAHAVGHTELRAFGDARFGTGPLANLRG